MRVSRVTAFVCPRAVIDFFAKREVVIVWNHRKNGSLYHTTRTNHRCVLLHGLFEVWGHGRNQEEAAKDASR